MFRLEIEPNANLIKLVFVGHLSAKEMKACAEQFEELLKQVQPGFRLLTNLTGIEAMDLDSAPYIKDVMDSCNQAGIGMVVRVIPDPRKDIGFNIMSLFHYRRGVRIVTCETLEQAQLALAN